MLIGELAQKTGFSRDTIRYYEKLGLIRVERRARRINGFKEYPDHLVERLRFIDKAKAMGFTLSELQEMFDLKESRDLECEDMERWAQEKVQKLAERIEALQSAKEKLEQKLAQGGRCSDTVCTPERLEE